MTSDPPPRPPASVLDLRPVLKRKRAAECPHDYAEVSETTASLTCGDCELEIDPWWYLRKLANDDERRCAEVTAVIEQYNAWCTSANEKLKRLHDEISQLTATKNRLYNEHAPDGRIIGQHVGRRRR